VGESNDRSRKGESDYVWALKDINFEIQQGDTVGIIGRNGAGKSTLLKLLSKVTAPTTGNVKVKGRIASLLEVGTGFHGELTGRENIYLNGAIMGMRKHEITRRLDEIVDFAGVERYLDTPVKRYSSGMYVRLGFAVAAHLDNEILIVDEVLAVGDAEFQKKCLGKMGDVAKGEGRTVLFVSHNLAAIHRLCNKGMFLLNGIVKDVNTIDKVTNMYLCDNNNKKDELIVDLSRVIRSNGNKKVIKKIWIENNKSNIVKRVELGDDFIIKFQFESNDIISNALFGFGIENDQGQRITSLNNEISGDEIPKEIKSGVVELKVCNLNLIKGFYFVSISIVSNQTEWVDFVEQAISFEVVANDIYKTGKLITSSQGIVYLKGNIKVYQK
jgi:lipopolysaccharide transport system ATP-binding protein